MITGVRGPGKTVMMTELSDYFEQNGWITLDISPDEDIVASIIANLYNEKGIKSLFTKVEISVAALGISASVSRNQPDVTGDVVLKQMLGYLRWNNKENTDNYYAVQPYLDNEGNELCNLYSIEIGKNHTFLRKYDYIIVSAENLNKWYEPCTSRPDEFASFVKTSSVNGTLYIEGIAVAASEDGFWCYSKDGKYYGRDIEPSSMIGFYDFSNAYIYDEDWGGVYKTKDELYDLEPYEKVAYGDSYVEFNQNIKNTGYTEVVSFVTTDYNVKANPLTITAKEKPSATISCSADGFTKAVGDAAFSIGAKTNAEKLMYVSDNNQVATVSGSGIVTVVGAGTANITVTASGSEYKTATKIIKITVEAAKVGYSVKDKSGATYKVTNVDANDIEVEYKPSSKASKKVSIPSNITVNGIKANVTSISQNAFSNNKKVTEVVIPKTVVKIEKNAFKNCKKLKKITISENVTTIGAEAFTGDKKLKTIIIKSSKITKTGSKAFKNVPRTAKITVPKKMKKKYRSMFKKAGFKGTVK